MKILHFNNTEEFEGGTEVFVPALVKAQTIHETLLVTLSPNKKEQNKTKHVIKIPASHLVRKAYGVTFYPQLYRELKKITNTFKPDIVHLHNIDKYPLTVIKAFAGQTIVKTVNDYGIICPSMWGVYKDTLNVCEAGYGMKCLKHCLNPASFAIHGWLSHIKNKYYKKHIKLFLSPSKLQHTYLTNHGYRTRLLENFMLHTINPRPTTKRKNYFLYLGGISKQKGIFTLIEAFKDFKNYKLYICGSGESLEDAKKLATEHIIVRGRISEQEKIKRLRECTAVIIPSLWLETGPHVGMEAMAENTPVIASDIGGMKDYVVDGKNGFFFKRGNATDLTRTLNKFIAADLNELSATNKQQLRKYSTERHINKLESIYKEISHG